MKLNAQPQPLAAINRLAYTVEEAAEALAIGRTSVFALIRDGELRTCKLGRRTVIPVTEVAALLERRTGYRKAG